MDLLLIFGLFAYLSNRNKSRGTIIGSQDTSTVAFLYQLPGDSYTTTRLAASSGGDDPQEIGIFDTPDKAKSIAQSRGWSIAHGGQVIQLPSKPGTSTG